MSNPLANDKVWAAQCIRQQRKEGVLTVAELIQALQELPQDLPVVRGDTDWGWVLVSKVEQVLAQGSTDGRGWIEYYPEVSEEPSFKAVKLS